MKAIRVHNYGGPEVLKYEEMPAPAAGKGEAMVKIAAAGLNFIDIYFRTGLSKAAQLPFTPGHEAAGTVTSVGEGVTEVKPGDRVAYAMTQGAYAEYAVVPAWRLVKRRARGRRRRRAFAHADCEETRGNGVRHRGQPRESRTRTRRRRG